MARPCPRGRGTRELAGEVSRGPRRAHPESARVAAPQRNEHDGGAIVLRHRPSSPEDSWAGTARCATRGCRQVFGLGTRRLASPTGYRFPDARRVQCLVAFVSHTAAGQRRLWTSRWLRPYRLPY
ncbi:hypothetical protein GLA29479_4770 [Lysobacter antibioticus]|nr:hypothetical protein GLA29479_4770 [Lysobacter antibioticus]